MKVTAPRPKASASMSIINPPAIVSSVSVREVESKKEERSETL